MSAHLVKCDNCGRSFIGDTSAPTLPCPNCGFDTVLAKRQEEENRAKEEAVKRIFDLVTLEKIRTYLTESDYEYLACKLRDKPQYVQAVTSLKFKDPRVALMLSVTAGSLGADRFYEGKRGLAVLKASFGVFTLGLWYVADWFLIVNSVKQTNYKKIAKLLTFLC